MLTMAELKSATGGILLQGKDKMKIQGISIDSRTLKRGDAFFAIKGRRFDGHKFIKGAVEKGASALVVSQKISCPQSLALIRVEDTTAALGDSARYYRRQFSIPVIAVTGSAGKTTTKEMIASVLALRFNVLKNIKTENNQYGVPLTLLKLNAAHQAAVLELGTNQPGDIARLAQIAYPTIGVLTNIGESHLEKLHNPKGVFHEKISLIRQMDPYGTIIFNSDDFYLKKIARMKTGHKKIGYGFDRQADVRAVGSPPDHKGGLKFRVDQKNFTISSPARHNIYNALSAIGCGRLLGLKDEEIENALARFSFCEGRQRIEQAGRLKIIDDTYNANPVSFRSAVETLRTFPAKGRKMIVCADMLELGAQSKALHEQMGMFIKKVNIDCILATGKYMRYMIKTLKSSKRNNAYFIPSLEALHRQLKKLVKPGDVILIKGSRSMHMERTVEFLKKNLN